MLAKSCSFQRVDQNAPADIDLSMMAYFYRAGNNQLESLYHFTLLLHKEIAAIIYSDPNNRRLGPT